jgi:hypothetical protein
MKKLITILVLLASLSGFAQCERYVAAMQKNLVLFDSAKITADWQAVSAAFERIGDAEKTQWLPYYYASYCTVMNAFTEEDKTKTDAIADKAEQLITKAEEILGKENSETDVVKSMIASAHMMVDPQTRWQQYGQASSGNIEKAKQLDPTNPRPVFLEGQAKFYTPEAFGGGKAPAKPLFEKALAMFDTFKAETPLHPNWGKAATEYFLSLASK